MKRIFLCLLLSLCGLALSAQQRRPIDNEHPLWMIHIDVWNTADPQKIIDLIPEEIRPYVCMNLSLSCQFDVATSMYRMPRSAVRTFKSWATVCQLNRVWFTCQQASGGHAHLQDDDLETFEYFFKTYPNFLGWNYAEQFWGFDEPGDLSSAKQEERIALFAKLVEMSHKYGGFLTISFCGNIWSHGLNPLGMMKRNPDLLKACRDYPEAILWLYKYTTSSCFYNNESVTWGPFVGGLATNYGIRYDNCGWNGALDALLGEKHGKTYPGAAGIGTALEQMCVNGGAVWDGPELTTTEDFKNPSTTLDGNYLKRSFSYFPNFDRIWLDMFAKVVDGTLYIPTRQEVVERVKVAVINDVSSGNEEQKYASWDNLYDGLYKQTDPFNRNNGYWMDNLLYLKKTGRYGAIPVMIEAADELAKKIPVQVKKSSRNTYWPTTDKKVEEFNKLYPEVSKGDLYVNRLRNQLVTYTPYSYLNGKKSATARIPLKYNTCDTLELKYDVLSSGVVREYADHIDFYLNNFRNDTTTVREDIVKIEGVKEKPSFELKKHASFSADVKTSYSAEVKDEYNEAEKSYTLYVTHLGPLDLSVYCNGNADRSDMTDAIPADYAPSMPKQPEPYNGIIIIEAEDMDYRSVGKVAATNSGWWAPEYSEFSGVGFVEMGVNKKATLRHQLTLPEARDYDIYVRYCKTSADAEIEVSVNGDVRTMTIPRADRNDWKKLKVEASLIEGQNTFIITNTSGVGPTIDQIIYVPKGTPAEKFLVTIRDAENGKITADVKEAAEGETVTLTVTPEEGYALKELRIVNSVYYSMSKTIEIDNSGEITFTMPDDNVTIQPVFYDNTSVYKLNFANEAYGAIPAGWRCTQENKEVHQYPNTYTSGSRIFKDFTGYQGKALYWRNGMAEYGTQKDYRLTLEPGEYKLSFAMAAWKAEPSYDVVICKADTDAEIAHSEAFTPEVNANGDMAADVSAEKEHEFTFNVAEKGDYAIRFADKSTTPGYHEFLLLSCRLIKNEDTGVEGVTEGRTRIPAGIYSPQGIKISSMQSGLNIVIDADGNVRKVMVK